MKHSLSYYAVLFILKIKGIKKNFSQDPIDVQKVRKEDVHEPNGAFFKKYTRRTFDIAESRITEIETSDQAEQLLIFVHGGAFISGPSALHWDTIQELAKKINYKIWLCDYPKAPEHKINVLSENVDAVYQAAQKDYRADHITCIGDSVGGTLILTLMQRLIAKQQAIPKRIILISPVMDASLSNPEILEIDARDPMLARKGILSAKKMCAGDLDLKNDIISPLYGNFEHFPPTTMFIGERDIMYPDQKLAVAKFKEVKIDFEAIIGGNMPHIWPLLPVMKEAKSSLNTIIRILNE